MRGEHCKKLGIRHHLDNKVQHNLLFDISKLYNLICYIKNTCLIYDCIKYAITNKCILYVYYIVRKRHSIMLCMRRRFNILEVFSDTKKNHIFCYQELELLMSIVFFISENTLEILNGAS